MDENLGMDWPVKAEKPPALSSAHWAWISLIGLTLASMALAQLVSFSSFTGTFEAEGLHPAKFWGALVVAAELWGAAGFFKISLSRGFRKISNFMALLAGGFWAFEAFRLASQTVYVEVLINNHYRAPGLGFFGGYLYQLPGFAGVVEAVVLILLIISALQVMEAGAKVTSTKRKRR